MSSTTTGTTTPPAATGAPCTTGAPAVPAGTKPKKVVDVDGDGKADSAFIAVPTPGDESLNILTAAGGGATFKIESASPIARSVLIANADQAGPVEVFVDDGRSTQLLAFVNCSVQPILNPQAQPYIFDTSGIYGTGTGIGCVATPAGRRLVGLHAISPADGGPTVQWTQTVVELNGLQAHNGATSSGTFTQGKDDPAIELLHQVTCGSLTIVRDGIQEPPGSN